MLRTLTTDGRWDAVIAHLPVGAEASQVCRGAADGREGLRIAAVLAALEGDIVEQDVLGEVSSQTTRGAPRQLNIRLGDDPAG